MAGTDVLETEAGARARRVHFMMGTFVEIEAHADHRARAAQSVQAAFSEMKRIERLLSRFLDTSAVWRANRSAAETAVSVPPEVCALAERALGLSRLTQGAFDITALPLTNLWEQSARTGLLPRQAALESALSRTGYSQVRVTAGTHTLFFRRPGVRIDFGAIGKGYAIDRAGEVLRDFGVRRAFLNAGGNVCCLDDEAYSEIGVRNPLAPDEILATLLLKNETVATSASYERFFEIAGERLSHVIDPRTGRPASNGVLSASVVSASGELADALATAVLILGPEAGMALIESRSDAEALLVRARGGEPEVCVSSGLRLHS